MTEKEEYKIGNLMFELFLEEDILIDEIAGLEKEVLKEERRINEYECKLWLKTDFKGKKLSNKELREAYVKKKKLDFITDAGHKKIALNRKKMRLSAVRMHLQALSLYDVDQLVSDWVSEKNE